MTVVVTGATGHIGANLVRSLLKAGQPVRALCHNPGHNRSLEGLEIERVAGDVLEPASLRAAFEGAEVVYHLAAKISIVGDPTGEVWATNVAGARNAAEAALHCGVRRYVHVSSCHAFDMNRKGEAISEEAPRPGPGHPVYDRSKFAGEGQVRRVVEQGLDAVIVNPAGVLGPHDYGPSRMGQFFLKLIRQELPALVAGGFHWVDSRDLAQGLMAAAERGRSGANYLLVGQWLSVEDLAGMAAVVTGVSTPAFVSPMWAARLGAPFVAAIHKLSGAEPLYTAEGLHALRAHKVMSAAKAEADLGWSPRSIQETVEAVYASFAERGLVERVGGKGRFHENLV